MNKFYIVSKKQFVADGGKDAEYQDIKKPIRATTISSGYDFFAPFDFTLKPGESIKIPSGIRVELDEDKWLMTLPRSGSGMKYRLQLNNTVGNIDADYFYSDNEGHIQFMLTNDTNEGKTLTIKRGEGFAQGVIVQYFKTVDDDARGKRNGGFGSTTDKRREEEECCESDYDWGFYDSPAYDLTKMANEE